MQFSITKSGLEIFDTCRAWGLANLLYAACNAAYSPLVYDSGISFTVDSHVDPAALNLKSSDVWGALKADHNWQNVFLTYKQKWTEQRNKAVVVLEKAIHKIIKLPESGLAVEFDGGVTLPGPLDPIAFKGLRGTTISDYREDQIFVDEINWALGSLGAVTAQKYKLQRASGGKRQHYVTLPVPEEVLLDDFREIRELAGKRANLNYAGLRVAAAHYSVLLADAFRERSQTRPGLRTRLSKLYYFSMFRSGQQVKPAAGGVVSTAPLIALVFERPAVAYAAFSTWNYLFRRGSLRGNEDLGFAVAELILSPSLSNYWKHARRFNRYVVDSSKRVDPRFLYSEDALVEVMKYAESRTESN